MWILQHPNTAPRTEIQPLLVVSSIRSNGEYYTIGLGGTQYRAEGQSITKQLLQHTQKHQGLLKRFTVGNATKMWGFVPGVHSYILTDWQTLGHSRSYLLSLYHEQVIMTSPGNTKRVKHRPGCKGTSCTIGKGISDQLKLIVIGSNQDVFQQVNG